MAAPLHTTTLPNPHTYVYRIAYGASAELSIAANQIDHMVHTDQCKLVHFLPSHSIPLIHILADIDTTVHSKDAIVFLQSIIAGSLKKTDTYDNRALTSLSKNIQYFQQSCQRFFDLVKQKPTKKIATPLPPPTDPYASPPRNNQDTTHVLSGWHRGIPMLMSTLDHASRYLSHSLHLLKSNKQQPHHINGMEKQSMAYVDSMVLLAKLQLLIKQDAEASRQAYSYLQSAEQLCSDFDYSAGYHCVALGYRTLGVYLASHSMNSESIYPLRKSCTLLEKHFEQTPTDENALQLCKRYDTLGVGYQKKGDYEQAARAFRQALRRLPTSAIDAFVKNASTMAPSSMVSRNPLISKAMDRFLRSSIIDMDEEGLVLASDIMNLSNVTPVDACAIYECELGILQAIMVKRDVLLHQEKIIHKLMKVYTVKEYPIRRAR
ncbi:hypothetical protein BDF14DRAFT_1736135 [Spinellus fusiger]|nr:hypothetical protein BDF14DRAFT_1736135 [Spinellus fusiger]